MSTAAQLGLSLSPVPAMYTVARRPAEVVQKTRRGETETYLHQSNTNTWQSVRQSGKTFIILGSLQSPINVNLQCCQTRHQSDMSACQLFLFPHCWKYLGSPHMTGPWPSQPILFSLSAEPSFPVSVGVIVVTHSSLLSSQDILPHLIASPSGPSSADLSMTFNGHHGAGLGWAGLLPD